MVIEKILKELTPERAKKEIEAIQKVKLPPELQKWIKEYEKVGERDEFIWKWAYVGWKFFTPRCVEKKYRDSVIITKTYNTILNVLVDDLADKRQDRQLLEEAIKIILKNGETKNKYLIFNKTDQKYLNFIRKIWKLIQNNIKKYPRYEDFKDIFEYDYWQFLNTMRYSYLVNKNPNFINLIEHEAYSHHNMQGMIGMTIDLMCSLNFNIKELGIFREISWKAQQMGRIGNLIVTWEREISKNDFTSGVFAYALEKNIISIKNIGKNEKIKIIKKIKESKIEEYFLEQWERYYNEIDHANKKIRSYNVDAILKGSERFLMMHLASKNFDI